MVVHNSFTETILIVDDDEDTRILCERELRFEGYATQSVSSGEEAIQFLERNPQVALIVLDIKMSPLDGIQVLERIRKKKVTAPVILYSDYPSYKDNFETWFADAFVVKSSDFKELKEKVKTFLTTGRWEDGETKSDL
jgi:DNA-binding response OmpR family regulator